MGTFGQNGHVFGKMGAKWAIFGQMGMFHIGIAYNPHANTSFNCFGFSISNTKFKINK